MAILHIDMDAFYASVEQRDHPPYRGKPVIVGGLEGRGVVSAASYEARRFGIHSAMNGARAKQLCPDGIFIKGRIGHYAEVGRQVREVFLRYTPLVQPLSLDEAFLDVSGTVKLFGPPAHIGWEIKAAIERELDLTASVGVAPLKFVAKIASDLNKPDGFVEVHDGGVIEFLDPLPISRLWGVGKVGQAKLERIGLHRIGDVRRYDAALLRAKFGRWGDHLWRLANAIDPRQVIPDRQAKSIGHERTFRDDIDDDEMLRAVVMYLAEQVGVRLRRHQRRAKTVSLKYRREDFQTFNRSITLSEATDSTDLIFESAMGLLAAMRRLHPRPVRLIGVSVDHLTQPNAPEQLSLFDRSENETTRRQVDNVLDKLQQRIGDGAVYRAASHRWIHRDRRG